MTPPRSPFASLATVRVLALALALVLGLGATGCAGLKNVMGFEEQVEKAQAMVRIAGRIETEGPARGTLVVLLARAEEGGEAEDTPVVGVDTYVRDYPGTYLFLVAAGRYQVGAYEDQNGNGLLDSHERVYRVRGSPIYDLKPGESARADLVLKDGSELGDLLPEPVDVLALVERTASEQRQFSLWAFSKHGTICEDLQDERFGPKAGPRGLWRPMDFLNDELAGIYFLEPYDPRRIPVLFVHGIAGYPQEFSTLIEELDTERFQPWFYFYPSGFALDGISGHLATLLERVQIETGFDEIAVVAHSMGGLVSRGAILKYATDTQRNDVRLFVSISTPWGGDVSAKRTEDAPIQLPPSFKDMNPSSDYLRWVFYEDEEKQYLKPLPRRVDYHLIWGFGGSGAKCNDGSVSCASQAREEAQEQALSIRSWNYEHVPILHSPEAVARVKLLLDQKF